PRATPAETVRGVLRDMCESAGCAVLTAKDGKEGVEAFREHAHEISLVMLDMTMPHMGGPETFQAIRKIQPDARVVLMSGHNEVEAASRFVGKGLAGFLQKPISLSSPYGKMQEVLD
ncbi:MAG TPA: response regulator, partial [Gemmatimonadetes bacterium]|nr:response regulator [Gemmatimonadota bacterium]